MSDLKSLVSQMLVDALHGKGSHVDTLGALEGLKWMDAGERPGRVRHSVYRTLNHMSFWQDLYVKRMRGEVVHGPEHAEGGWPGPEEPGSSRHWAAALERFRTGLEAMVEQARTGDLERVVDEKNGTTAVEAIHIIAAHNSYHLGQIVLLRRSQGAWPPPGGGDTW
jgi:uncharacterized damage-inducible protein DinB